MLIVSISGVNQEVLFGEWGERNFILVLLYFIITPSPVSTSYIGQLSDKSFIVSFKYNIFSNVFVVRIGFFTILFFLALYMLIQSFLLLFDVTVVLNFNILKSSCLKIYVTEMTSSCLPSFRDKFFEITKLSILS